MRGKDESFRRWPPDFISRPGCPTRLGRPPLPLSPTPPLSDSHQLRRPHAQPAHLSQTSLAPPGVSRMISSCLCNMTDVCARCVVLVCARRDCSGPRTRRRGPAFLPNRIWGRPRPRRSSGRPAGGPLRAPPSRLQTGVAPRQLGSTRQAVARPAAADSCPVRRWHSAVL